jgi:capsular polysaccharide transport system permease protein
MIRREMLARYGRNQAGYLWAILQPLLYVSTFEIIFIFAQRHVPLGVTLEQFLITGIVPVVCFFMNIEQKVMSAINGHRNLLYFREVTTLNILFAAWLLEFMTAIAAMLAILCVLFLMGQHFTIRDPLEILSALAGMSLTAVVMGGFFGIISLRYASAIFIGRAVNRFLFFLSGAFFYASELPQTTREYILLNPLFHYVEFVREGFFTSYQATYASWTYPLQFTVPGLALLLLADRIFRRHVFEA